MIYYYEAHLSIKHLTHVSGSKYRNPTSLKEVLAKEEVQVRIEVVFKKDLAAAYSTRRSNGTVQSTPLRSAGLTYRR